jgi:hypothetical protein
LLELLEPGAAVSKQWSMSARTAAAAHRRTHAGDTATPHAEGPSPTPEDGGAGASPRLLGAEQRARSTARRAFAPVSCTRKASRWDAIAAAI